MELNERCAWHFVNGPWAADSAGDFRPTAGSRDDDGLGLQGYRLAFCTEHAYGDLGAHFRVRHDIGHTDAGLIFGATDPQNFFVLHFPDCGQASRAQNFWMALSRMDGAGVLRIVKLGYVRRVASHPRNVWHDVELRVSEDRLEARIDGRGVFEVAGCGLGGAGFVGLMGLSDARIGGATVEGEPAQSVEWSDGAPREAHWFHPCPGSDEIWQRPANLVRDESGELLLLFQESRGTSWRNERDLVLVRSSDDGRTWADRRVITRDTGNYCLHRFPDGQLKLGCAADRTATWRTSSDAGRSWSDPTEGKEMCAPLEDVKQMHWGPQVLLNLRDGSILMILYGPSTFTKEDLGFHSWGSSHWHAYTCRSVDGGGTWSPLAHVDNRGEDAAGKVIGPNHDLTEVCIAEVEEGRLLALIRPIYSPWMWETWSEDSGQSWGPCVRGPFPGYATPNMLCTSSGAVLVAHRLPSLTVHCSRDRGETFDEGTTIDSSMWAMGSMIEIEPDLVLYVYWDTFYSLMRGQFLRVTDSGLVPERKW